MKFKSLPFLFFVGLFPFFSAHAFFIQDKSVDELVKEAEALKATQPEEAFELYHQAASVILRSTDHQRVATVVSQAVNLGFRLRGNYQDRAIELLKETLPLMHEVKREDLDVAMIYYSAGYYYYNFLPLQWDKALEYFEKAKTIRTQLLGEQSEEVASCYGRLGDVYKYLLFDFANAEACYEKSIHIRESLGLQDKMQLSRSYYNLATTNRSQRDYERALSYGIRTIELVRQLNDPAFLERTYSIVGNIYRDMGKPNEATDYYQQAIKLNTAVKQRSALYDETLAGHYQNYATLLKQEGHYDEALRHFKDAAKIYARIEPSEKTMKVNCFQNMAETYVLKNQYKEALNVYRSALATLRELNLENSRQTAEVYAAIGDLFGLRNNFDSALVYYQQALVADVSSFTNTDVHVNPTVSAIGSDYYLYNLFLSKAQTLYKIHSADPAKVEAHTIVECLIIAEDLLRKSRNSLDVEESKWRFLDSNYDLYEQSIAILYNLRNEIDEDQFFHIVFSFLEYSKSRTLADAVQEAELSGQAFATDSLIRQQNALKASLFNLQDRLTQEEARPDPDRENIVRLRSEMVDVDRKIQQAKQSIAEKFPGYFKARFESQVPDLDALVRRVNSEGATLIEYFWGIHSVYAMVINGNSRKLTRVGSVDSIRNAINPLVNYLTGHESHLQLPVFMNFVNASYSVFNLLIEPVAGNNLKRRLIIIPDGLIAQLPFEILTRYKVDAVAVNYKVLPYLIVDHDISYSYSSSVWLSTSQAMDRRPRLLGMSFSGDQPAASDGALQELPGSATELNYISKRFRNSELLSGADASKGNFKRLAPECDVIHLAIHGQGDPEKRYGASLYFKPSGEADDGELHAYELYGLKLHAKLAILSSCESGLGMNYKGEGMISMASAFAYAGCENVIMSLWKVRDQQSAELLDQFYSELDGNTIDVALSDAKRNYLNNSDALTADPRLWAALVAYGDMEPIFPQRSLLPAWLWGAGIVVLAMLIVVFVRRRRN